MLLEDVYQEFLTYDKDKLLAIATENARNLYSMCLSLTGNANASYGLLVIIFSSFIGGDGKVDDSEYNLFRDVTGVEYVREDFDKIVNESSKADVIEKIDMLVDSSIDAKEYVVNMGLAICAFDGDFSQDEKDLIEKYFTDYSLNN